MDPNATEIERLIGGILTPQQDIHEQAQDAYFKCMEANPSQLFLSLGHIMKLSQHPQARLFAAVILRQQSLPAKQLMSTVDQNVINELKSIALELCQTEPNAAMRKKVIEFAGIFAARLFKQAIGAQQNPVTAWPEILNLTCTNAGTATNPDIRASSFDMLRQIGEFSVQVFDSFFLNPEDTSFLPLFINAMQPTIPIQIGISASTAVLSILVSYHQIQLELTRPGRVVDPNVVQPLQAAIKKYQSVVPSICSVFVRALQENQENSLTELIDSLDQFIQCNPRAFAPCFVDFINLIQSIALNEDLEPVFRQQCISLLTQFGVTAAGRKLAQTTPQFEAALRDIAFKFLLQIGDDDEWSKDPLYLSQDEQDNPNFHLGLFILRPLPVTLTSKYLTPLFQQIISRAQKNDWREQYAALTVFSVMCEEYLEQRKFPKGTQAGIRKMIASFLDPNFTSRAHPRVIVAALIAAVSYITRLGEETSLQILPSILKFVPTDINALNKIPPTIVFYSSRALTVLSAILVPSNLLPNCPTILAAASSLLQHPQSSIVNSALSLLSSIAQRLESKFAPFADSILQHLFTLTTNLNTQLATMLQQGIYKTDQNVRKSLDQQHDVRNKVIECISFIAEALGHDGFLPYGLQSITLMCQSQEIERQYPNPCLQFIFSAYQRLANCLQEDFAPYIGTILPGLLASASAQDFHFRFDLDNNANLSFQDQLKVDELKSRGFSTLDIDRRGLGDQRVAIHAATVQDKIQSIEIIGEFALTLKAHFAPYLMQVVQVLLPECTTLQNPRIRWSSVTTLPALFECFYQQPNIPQEQIIAFFVQIINSFNLPEWIEKELPQGLAHLLQATTAIIDGIHHAGIPTLPDDMLQIISQGLLRAWSLCLERRYSIEQEVLVGDEEFMEARVEAIGVENDALDACVALNTTLIRTNRDKYWPFFVQCIQPLYFAAIGPDNLQIVNEKSVTRDPYLKSCGYIGFADAIGNSNGLGLPLVGQLLPQFLTGALDSDAQLRRGCAYGITACHRSLPMADFAPYVSATVEILVKSAGIEYDPPETEEYIDEEYEDACYAADNALSGLTDIMSRYGCGFGVPQCIHSQQEQANFASIQGFINTEILTKNMGSVLEKLGRFHDEEEATCIHKNVALWLTKCPESVYGSQLENVPHVIRSIAHILDLALEYDIVDDDDLEVYKNTWRSLRTRIPQEAITKILSVIDPEIVGQLNFQ